VQENRLPLREIVGNNFPKIHEEIRAKKGPTKTKDWKRLNQASTHQTR